MSILDYLFSNSQISKLYDQELKDLKKVKKEFEHYIFLVYEKISIISEVKNKVYDIKGKNLGFIKEDEKRFVKKNSEFAKYGLTTYDEKNLIFYYKKWVNRRLKRIKKILELEIKSDKKLLDVEGGIIETIRKLENSFNEVNSNGEFLEIKELIELFNKLRIILTKQYSYIKEVYPIKDWSIETHEKLFPNEFIILLKEEINLIFDKNFDSNNYNEFLALVSRKIHEKKIPIKTTLGNLIRKNILKIKESRKNSLNNKNEFISCYHARPVHITKPLLPLDVKSKATGFFIDLNMDEAINIVCSIYGINRHEVEVYRLSIPKNLFRYAVRDNTSDMAFKNFEMLNSFIFKPTDFPKFNEFYVKGLIYYEKITPIK